MRTCVPLGPLSRETASSIDSLSVGSFSMRWMTSPARMPSREAGVPSIGAITQPAVAHADEDSQTEEGGLLLLPHRRVGGRRQEAGVRIEGPAACR